MSSILNMDALRQRHAEAKRADHARNALIEDLLAKIDDMQKTMDRNAFVMVLIDGDCMNFLNELVKQGMAGGDEAAKLLRRAVFDYLRYDKDFNHDTKIVIRVYANLRGLSKTYADTNILPNVAAFADFVLGFNKAHPLCDFIDAGNHKEAADTKLKEILTLYVYNVHCKQIIFGASADNGYASFLSSFFIDTDVSSHIRILKGPPFSFEFKNIISKFRWTEFKNVFRNDFISKDPPWRRSQEVERQRTPEAFSSTTNNTSSLAWRPKDTSRHAAKASVSDSTMPLTKDLIEFPENESSAAQEDAIKSALVRVTNQRLKETPKSLDFGFVKQRVENILELPSDFWGKDEKNEWFLKSKNIIKKAVEDWVKETGNPPPKNATWMMDYFPPVPNHSSSTSNNVSSASSRAEQAVAVHTKDISGTTDVEPTLMAADERETSEDSDDSIQSPVHEDTKGNAKDYLGTARNYDEAEPSVHRERHEKAADGGAALDEPDEPRESPVYQNSRGQRIDIPVQIHYDKESLYRLRARPKKLCNSFYLGSCQNGDRCQFDHEPVLSKAELVALRYLARCNPCSFGSACKLADCTKGHVCPYQDKCDTTRCKFKEMCNIDIEVANVIEGERWA